jgi:TolA-binding protein
MNPVDVHPEDLLDKAIEQNLTADERRRLQQHVAHCHACGIEWRALGDFAEERSFGSADQASLARILGRMNVNVALEATGQHQRSVAVAVPRRRPRFVAYAAAAAVLFVAAGAAAVFQTYRWGTTVSVAVQGPVQSIARLAPVPPEPAPQPKAAVVLPESESAAKPRSTERSAMQSESASQIFSRANEARRRGEYAQALKAYAELQESHANSAEALTSRVAVGRLLLDRLKDPAGALRAFDRYLARQAVGSLAEEARVGRALSLTALGRKAEARKAWQFILQKYPKSVHAERARRRLQELQ